MRRRAEGIMSVKGLGSQEIKRFQEGGDRPRFKCFRDTERGRLRKGSESQNSVLWSYL